MNTLSVVIPVYNEEKRLKKTFKALYCGVKSRNFELCEVIFVNDGSTDDTLSVIKKNKTTLAKKIKAEIGITSYVKNRGKGYAVKRGMQKASGDHLLVMDADISTPLSELSKLESKVFYSDIVIGTRKNGHSTVVVPQPLYRQFLGHVYTFLSQLILNVWVTDFTCGFKLFNFPSYKKISSRMKISGWGYDAEVMYLAKKYGFVVNEAAVEWANDSATKVNLAKDIVKSLSELIEIRFNDFTFVYNDFHPYATLKNKLFSWAKVTSQ